MTRLINEVAIRVGQVEVHGYLFVEGQVRGGLAALRDRTATWDIRKDGAAEARTHVVLQSEVRSLVYQQLHHFIVTLHGGDHQSRVTVLKGTTKRVSERSPSSEDSDESRVGVDYLVLKVQVRSLLQQPLENTHILHIRRRQVECGLSFLLHSGEDGWRGGMVGIVSDKVQWEAFK